MDDEPSAMDDASDGFGRLQSVENASDLAQPILSVGFKGVARGWPQRVSRGRPRYQSRARGNGQGVRGVEERHVITRRRTCGTVNPFPVSNRIPTETVPNLSRTHGRRCRGGRRVSKDTFILSIHGHLEQIGSRGRSRGEMGVAVEFGSAGGKGR